MENDRTSLKKTFSLRRTPGRADALTGRTAGCMSQVSVMETNMDDNNAPAATHAPAAVPLTGTFPRLRLTPSRGGRSAAARHK